MLLQTQFPDKAVPSVPSYAFLSSTEMDIKRM